MKSKTQRKSISLGPCHYCGTCMQSFDVCLLNSTGSDREIDTGCRKCYGNNEKILSSQIFYKYIIYKKVLSKHHPHLITFAIQIEQAIRMRSCYPFLNHYDAQVMSHIKKIYAYSMKNFLDKKLHILTTAT